jgi:hypothetical protein
MKFLLALSRRIGLLRGGMFYINKALKDDKKNRWPNSHEANRKMERSLGNSLELPKLVHPQHRLGTYFRLLQSLR